MQTHDRNGFLSQFPIFYCLYFFPGYMAISAWIFFEIFLMILLRGTEARQWLHFYNNRFLITFCQLLQGSLDNRLICFIHIVNTCSILFPDIISLTIYGYRVDDGVKLIPRSSRLPDRFLSFPHLRYSFVKAQFICAVTRIPADRIIIIVYHIPAAFIKKVKTAGHLKTIRA